MRHRVAIGVGSVFGAVALTAWAVRVRDYGTALWFLAGGVGLVVVGLYQIARPRSGGSLAATLPDDPAPGEEQDREEKSENELGEEDLSPLAYIRFGGIRGGRPLDPEDRFEQALDRLFRERIRASLPDSVALWRAITNVRWTHENGETVSHTYRAAGDVISAIYGSGDYMDWYYNHGVGEVAAWIAEGLAREGWTRTADREAGTWLRVDRVPRWIVPPRQTFSPPLRVETAARAVARDLKAAGIDQRALDGTVLDFHALRVTLGTRLCDANVPQSAAAGRVSARG